MDLWKIPPVDGSYVVNLIQWIGLREFFSRKAPYLMGKSMVSCKISLKPIQSLIESDRIPMINIWQIYG